MVVVVVIVDEVNFDFWQGNREDFFYRFRRCRSPAIDQ